MFMSLAMLLLMFVSMSSEYEIADQLSVGKSLVNRRKKYRIKNHLM